MLIRLFVVAFALNLATMISSHANEEYKQQAAERRQHICNMQKAILNLSADIFEDEAGHVLISWRRATVPQAVQFGVAPSKRHPVETWIALDGNAQTNGRRLNNSWFKSMGLEDAPEWSFRGVSPGEHSVTVAQRSECGTWDMKGASFTMPEKESEEEFEIQLTDEEAEDLSFGANLTRYADCMIGITDYISIVTKGPNKWIVGKVTNRLSRTLVFINHPKCLAQATRAFETPPDPDEGSPNCFPQMGILTGCESEWITFYQSDIGTEALDRIGNGFAHDDTARVSCLATVYEKYHQYFNLDNVFNDPHVINQGCNRSRPR